MSDKINLPLQVKSEIDLYLGDGEAVIEAIPSTTGSVGKLGELWMLLTDRNVLFYTCEYNKDPVVALIGRKELQAITYEPHPAGITLTFVSLHRPQHPTRIAFLRAQRPLVNRFCEELSKDAPFEVIGSEEKSDSVSRSGTPPAGVRTVTESNPVTSPGSTPSTLNATSFTPEAPDTGSLKAPTDSTKTESIPPFAGVVEKPLPERVIEVCPPPSNRPPEVRIKTTLTQRVSSEDSQRARPLKPDLPPSTIPESKNRTDVNSASTKTTSEIGVKLSRPSVSGGGARESGSTREEWVPEVRFVVFSTIIALVVGFIWYRLFEAIGDSNTRR